MKIIRKSLGIILLAVLIGQMLTFGNAYGLADWTDDVFSGSADVQTSMQDIENNLMTLKTKWSSATEPANLSAFQWWADTTTGILKLRNAANTGWQYIWDFTNNQPMGSATTRGTIAYSGTQILSPVTLSRGTTASRIATSDFNFVINGGAPVNKPAVPAGTAWSTSYTIQQNTWGIYVVSVNGSGTITFTPGAGNYTAAYTTESQAIAAMPATPGGTCRIGYVTIKASSSAGWTEGTNNLYGGGGTNPAQATNYYPDTPTNAYTGSVIPTPSAYVVGIYYVKATYKNYITTPTINLNSLGAKTIKGPDGSTLGTGGTIISGHYMILYYDGTDMILLNPVITEHGMSVFTSSGTWIKPQGVNKVFVRVWGGGGGGGAGTITDGYDNTYTYGCGGDGGYSEGWISVSGNVTVTVGAAGSGAASAPGYGGTGGTSSFAGDSTIQATGGSGGIIGGSGSNGTGSGGTLNSRIESGSIITSRIPGSIYHNIKGTTGYGVGGSSGQYAGTSGGSGLVLVYW